MPQPSNIENLTPRELEILTLVAEGRSLPEIADQLKRSLKTIESHRLSIGRKLKASNRVELARIAIAGGLVKVGNDGVSSNHDKDRLPPEQELAWIGQINEAISGTTRTTYIRALCGAVTEVMGLRFCAVCISAHERGPEARFAVAMSDRGQELPSFYYALDKTPLSKVLSDGMCCIHDGLTEKYPEEAFSVEHKLRSYFGLRLEGEFGAETGVLAVVDDKPFSHPGSIEKVIRLFADRTSAELARIYANDQLRQLKLKLEQQQAES